MSRTSQLPNLDKLFKDEDDQDFTPLGGSNLAAIFGAPQKLGDASSSASIKRSSQRKAQTAAQQQQQTAATAKTEVIVAKAVHAYMLQNGQYSLIGKVGIALTGNTVSRIYQIILYKSKTEHISVVTLNPEFSYTIRENNYATYYDDKGENWSLHFENEESCVQVAREVGLSRFLCRPALKSDESAIMHQDLSVHCGEGLEAKEGDEITVKTTISWNLTQPLNYNASPTQTINVEISQDDNWERSLLNCSKGLKRLVLLHPSKQIGLGPGFPREKPIIMEIEVIDVVRPETKTPTPSPVITMKQQQQPPSSPPAAVVTSSTGKASILSRMAKMGQSMLPKVPTSTTTDSEDTEEEVHNVKSPSRRFKPEASKHHSKVCQESSEETAPAVTNISSVSKSIVPSSGSPFGYTPMMQQQQQPPSSVAFPNTWTGGAIQQQYVAMNGQYYPVHQQVPQPMPAPMDPNIHVLLSENRTHNAEIRMGMSKVADNVQKLLDKFHVLEVQSASTPINERAMETSLKMLMALNGKNAVNHAAALDSSAADDRSKESILALEKELKDSKELLEERGKTIDSLEKEKQEWSSERNDLFQRIERLEKSLADSNMSFQKASADLNSANKKITAYQKDNSNLEDNILKLNAEKKILEKANSDAKETTATGNDKAAEIKEIMNKTYQTLLAKFTEESYTTEYIKQTVAMTIRNITLQVLKEGRVDDESGSNIKGEAKSRDSKLTDAVPSDSSAAIVIDDDKSSAVSLPEIPHRHTAAASIGNNINIIPVAQEEPPPIPPMDINTSEQGEEWVIP